jgi:AraC-like DNA-binding protein
LFETLVAAPDGDAVAKTLEAALVERLRAGVGHASWSAPLARRAAWLLMVGPNARALADHEGGTRIADLATRLGTSTRHLRRSCLEAVGLTPKHLARIFRLRRALDRGTTNGASWSQIARDVGFYDHSHLIADAKALVGMTPDAFMQRRDTPPDQLASCSARAPGVLQSGAVST